MEYLCEAFSQPHRFKVARQEVLVLNHARVNGLHLPKFACSLLRLDESEAAVALPHAGGNVDADVVLLTGLQVQLDLRMGLWEAQPSIPSFRSPRFKRASHIARI